MRSQKGKSTIYTEQKRHALQYNAVHDPSVRAAAEECCRKAEEYLLQLDQLYDSIVSEGLFRYYFKRRYFIEPSSFVCIRWLSCMSSCF